jgi:hypothetical protein
MCHRAVNKLPGSSSIRAPLELDCNVGTLSCESNDSVSPVISPLFGLMGDHSDSRSLSQNAEGLCLKPAFDLHNLWLIHCDCIYTVFGEYYHPSLERTSGNPAVRTVVF